MSAAQSPLMRVHGGPDQYGVTLHDFSNNSNACGPCPAALATIRQADATQYPDASYTALRVQLANFHAVDVRRVVLAASASEFIFRITALVAQGGGQSVWLPPHSYGDYAQAAHAHGLQVVAEPGNAALCWACDPASPLGTAHESLSGLVDASVRMALDRAYEPLRLDGALALTQGQLQTIWQLWTPNKALGLTGVRAAYAIAPLGPDADVQTMEALCPSWPVGSHGVAMLQAWTQPDVQAWLAGSRDTLREWKARQVAMCESLGWMVLPSTANFFVCHTGAQAPDVAALRAYGIKLRDCTSFGLPGHVRMGVQSPLAQDALHTAWQHITRRVA